LEQLYSEVLLSFMSTLLGLGMNSTEGDSIELSHIEAGGGETRSRMVDVSNKLSSSREAVARATLVFPPGVLPAVRKGAGPKGPIEEVSRVAGILAAKRTGDLIPMCHPLGLDLVEILFEEVEGDPDRLAVICTARCTGPTGVEMEAMMGASVAALTIYDMTKAASKGIRIEETMLLSKKGGKSGVWSVA
jgi:cyclic pyranopterin phosphate synthase